ncbi:HD-GYP domain-containing protein [Sphingomonas sp. AP4-R1]|uniref:HD-GYP domain-containing protein n=1 Tax=Sphingomonas sp. AP4-R1 TaxID=2735134 RepID=UPI001493409C|nr:HD-GYP domain-containing protein [Sphingomonas sp. AP4-R1]QJU58125.1 HD-GYP domain-containing protein [Sphingomonas sp. AP4-R1]
MLRRIKPEQVRIGMYIQGFEGSWIHHPFWRSRFLIATEADVAKVHAADIPAVIIDDDKGLAPVDPESSAVATRGTVPQMAEPQPRRPVRTPARPIPPAPGGPIDERALANQVMNRSKKVMKTIFDGARLGRAFHSEEVRAVVEDISASVFRNAHALIGVTRLKSKDEYTYLHSVAVCALMINFARELGLEENVVRDLGMAGLLHDIGKMGVPEDVLNKPGPLDEAELALVHTHPIEGYRILAEGGEAPELALEVCLHHHEKMDGTGYPHGLSGDQISLAARMGAICDVYDALTSHRPYKRAWTPVAAIAAMASWHGHFDQALLFRFMQSILVFPVGMLVRLRSNRLAVVLDPGRRATAPRVRAFYSTTERAMLKPQEVTISNSFADDQIVSEERPDAWGLLGWEGQRDQLLGGSRAAA